MTLLLAGSKLNRYQAMIQHEDVDVGGCQKYRPSLGPYYDTAPNIQGTQKGTIILTATHVRHEGFSKDGALGEPTCTWRP